MCDDLVNLFFTNPGALNTDGLVRAHGQEQCVTLTDQLVRTGLVENHARVGNRGHSKGQTARNVGLDQTGHHID